MRLIRPDDQSLAGPRDWSRRSVTSSECLARILANKPLQPLRSQEPSWKENCNDEYRCKSASEDELMQKNIITQATYDKIGVRLWQSRNQQETEAR